MNDIVVPLCLLSQRGSSCWRRGGTRTDLVQQHQVEVACAPPQPQVVGRGAADHCSLTRSSRSGSHSSTETCAGQQFGRRGLPGTGECASAILAATTEHSSGSTSSLAAASRARAWHCKELGAPELHEPRGNVLPERAVRLIAPSSRCAGKTACCTLSCKLRWRCKELCDRFSYSKLQDVILVAAALRHCNTSASLRSQSLTKTSRL